MLERVFEMKNVGLRENILLERAFEVTKIGLYNCRVPQFSFEIFGFVWYENKSTGLTLHFMT